MRVHDQHAGKGVGTAAVRFCINRGLHGLSELGFEDIIIIKSPQNGIVMRLMTKLGIEAHHDLEKGRRKAYSLLGTPYCRE